jgi:hypothetical protein
LQQTLNRLAVAKSRLGVSKRAACLDQILEIVVSKPLLSNAVVRAILDVSDTLILEKDVVWEFFIIDNFERLDSILVFGLGPLSPEEREERVGLISSHIGGLSLCARVVNHLANQHGRHGSQARPETERYVSLDVVENAEVRITNRIREAARDGTLLSLASPITLIWFWKMTTGAEDVRLWISNEINSDAAVLRLAELLPNVSYQSGGDGRREIRSFKADTYKDILDANRFKDRLDEAVKATGSDDARRIREDFLAAEEAGKSSRF